MDPAVSQSEILIAGYPLWVAAVAGGLALVLAYWLFTRALRLLAVMVALSAVGVACFMAWQHVFG